MFQFDLCRPYDCLLTSGAPCIYALTVFFSEEPVSLGLLLPAPHLLRQAVPLPEGHLRHEEGRLVRCGLPALLAKPRVPETGDGEERRAAVPGNIQNNATMRFLRYLKFDSGE